MGKVSILTYWGVANYGAWTQAYALNRTVKSIVGPDVCVETLNYLDPEHFAEYYRSDEKLYNSVSYSWNEIPHSKHYTLKTIEKEHFDVLLAGSDSIWTFKNMLGSADYHLAGYKINANRKIAYAPSSGVYTKDMGLIPEIVDGISSFDYVSVRDKTTQELYNAMTGKEAELVVDPALLWNFKEDDRIITPTFKNYIAVYGYRWEESFIKEVKAYAKKRKLKLLSLGFVNDWCDMSFKMIELRGREWVGLIKKADCVITSTFHGLMLGLSFEKEVKYCQNKFTENRSNTLIEKLDIDVNRSIDESLNYKSITPKLNMMRDTSLRWLEKALFSKTE